MVGIRNRSQLFVLFVFGFDHGGEGWLYSGHSVGCGRYLVEKGAGVVGYSVVARPLGYIVVVMVIAGRLIVDSLE